jgi:hypothetical protein
MSTVSRSRRNLEAGHAVAWCARMTDEDTTLQRLRALTRFAAVARLARHLPSRRRKTGRRESNYDSWLRQTFRWGEKRQWPAASFTASAP